MSRHFTPWDAMTPEERAAKDITGQRFGSLTAVEQTESPNGYDKWVVDCMCGNRTVKDGMNLRSGGTQSCGNDCPYRRRRGRKSNQ